MTSQYRSGEHLFRLPDGLHELAHFEVGRIQTWGGGKEVHDRYKSEVRHAAKIRPENLPKCRWIVFCIRCVVGEKRGRNKKNALDVENIPKLIVDAFTSVLYPDDNLNYVRGVQVEAKWGANHTERAEVWIYGGTT